MKYFQDYSEITHLVLVKFNDFYKRKKAIDISNEQKEKLIVKLITYLNNSIESLSHPIIDIDLIKSKKIIWEKFEDLNSNFYSKEVKELQQKVSEFENQSTVYGDFSKACNSIIYLTRSIIRSNQQTLKGKDDVSISLFKVLLEDRLRLITKSKEILLKRPSRLNQNAEVLIQEASTLFCNNIEILNKRIQQCDLILGVQQELLSDDFFGDESDNNDAFERLDLIAKLFDSKLSVEKSLSDLFIIQYNKKVSSNSIAEELQKIKASYPSVPKELLERFFQIKCKNDYISKLAPRDIIAETAIMCEKILYIEIFLPTSALIDNFKSYSRKVGLKFSGENSLTIGFYIYWFDVDQSVFKLSLNSSTSLEKVKHELLIINNIRNKSLHKNNDKDIVITSDDSTNAVNAMEALIQSLYN